MQFNIRHLLSALEIQTTGTVSKAAKQIHLSQSALTQGINKLEKQIGHLLFTRSPSGMYTSEAGDQFLRRVRRAFSYLDDFSNIVFATERTKRHSFVRSVTSRQLRAFITIVEQQSYTIAAGKLTLSQPTLHRTIKDLEQLCEQKLFHRSPTGVEPTWRSRQLRRYASLFFAELQQGVEELSYLEGQISGSLRVGSLPLARTAIVPNAILALLQRYPEAEVNIVDGPYEEQLSALLHGQLDVIVGALRFPPPSDDIIQHRLFDDPLSIVVKANHPLASASSLNPQALQQIEWIGPRKGTPARTVFSQIFTNRGLTPPHHVIECSSLVAIRGLLLNSNRAALLPARQVSVEVDAGLLAVCPIPLSGTSREIGYATRKRWQPTKVQEAFLSLLNELTTIE